MAGPTLVSATITQTGRTLRTVWSEAVDATVTLPTITIRAITVGEPPSSGTITCDYPLSGAVFHGESGTMSAGAGCVTSTAASAPSAAVAGAPLANASVFTGRRVDRVYRVCRVRRP